MIFDRIDNTRLYLGLHAGFAKAFEILTDKTLSQKQDGKYPVDGDNIYYTIQRYTTKPLSEGKFEAHRKYIDIQFLLEGVEIIGYAPLKDLTTAEVYNPQKDIAFFNTPKEITKVILEPGLFCILFPADAHLPGLQLAGPTEVRKVVIKIQIKE
ncbi:MAG: YhcH/YjgK/YiaL family protein [Sedimentisphaerales bacterium]|jgi:YhcH/YjgK/YiaL family protein